jgi:hypothetical protein
LHSPSFKSRELTDGLYCMCPQQRRQTVWQHQRL